MLPIRHKQPSTLVEAMDLAYDGVKYAQQGINWAIARIVAGVLWLAGKLTLPQRVAALAGLSALVLVGVAWWLGSVAAGFIDPAMEDPRFAKVVDRAMLDGYFGHLALAPYVALLLVVAGAAALRRSRSAYVLVAIAWGALAGWALYLLGLSDQLPRQLAHTSQLAELYAFTDDMRDQLWLGGVLLWLPVAAMALWMGLYLATSAVRELYTAYTPAAKTLADRALANFLRNGDDPEYRKSSYWAVFLHVFLIVLPFLLLDCFWDRYSLPPGSGTEAIATPMQVKQVKKKKKKELVLNLNSPIIFYRPKIDEAEVMKEVDEETQDTYAVTALRGGKLGRGGGTEGGYPFGEMGKVRFIRLKYSGGDWDQDMGVGADYNMLIFMHQKTGWPIAENTESLRISRLKRFDKDHAPPFVFLTGSGNINISSYERKVLRWYLLEEGGMIFADNGGGGFHNSFMRMMRQVVPEKDWVDIPNDDIIFTAPYRFPSGAPPLWHHSGYRALGLKHNGRWIVFYHQGDLNDAWKTGHSGVKKSMAKAAYQLGINVIAYAFGQYHKMHFEQ